MNIYFKYTFMCVSTLATISITMLALDAIYISTIYSGFNKMVQNIQGSALSLAPIGAVACYIALIFGIYYFIIKDKRSPLDAGLLGLVIYVVYESTSYATLKNWDAKIAILDSVWGFALFYLTTVIVYWMKDQFRF